MICYFAQASPYGVRIPAEVRDFPLYQNVEICFGTHTATCSVGVGFYPGGKTVGASS